MIHPDKHFLSDESVEAQQPDEPFVFTRWFPLLAGPGRRMSVITLQFIMGLDTSRWGAPGPQPPWPLPAWLPPRLRSSGGNTLVSADWRKTHDSPCIHRLLHSTPIYWILYENMNYNFQSLKRAIAIYAQLRRAHEYHCSHIQCCFLYSGLNESSQLVVQCRGWLAALYNSQSSTLVLAVYRILLPPSS